MGEEDSGLMLNLDYSGKRNKRKHFQETRKEVLQRLRAPKPDDEPPQQKFLQPRPSTAQPRTDDANTTGATQGAAESMGKPRGQGAANRSKGTGSSGHGKVISSLFRNNPMIPEVQMVKVKSGKEAVFSAKSFHDLPLHPHLISTLEKSLEFSHMTSVQQRAIPYILNGRDTMVKSQTGSGKTLAYAVPIVNSLQGRDPKVQRSDGPYVLILVPTRELALQSFATLQKVCKPFVWIVPGYLMGGEKMKSEKARLRRGINILVATPGRLLDHIKNTGTLKLDKVQWLVMDEADRLLDMGYDRDVSLILNALNEKCPQRQNIFLSATLSEGVERLADMTLNDPVVIDMAKEKQSARAVEPFPDHLQEEPTEGTDNKNGSGVAEDDTKVDFTTPDGLQQFFVIVPSKLRLVSLAAFILKRAQTTGDCKMLVFLSSRDSVEFHYTLFKEGIKTVVANLNLLVLRLHGSMTQEERTEVFHKFQEAPSGILLCTDVAARGLDLPKVKWIVQYNTPGSPEDYVHRVGRTARIGAKGQSLLFLTPAEVQYLETLSHHKINVREINSDSLLSTLLTVNLSSSAPAAGNHHYQPIRNAQEAAGALQRVFEEFVNNDKAHSVLAVKAFQSFVRAYATYPTAFKHIFHTKKLHLGHTAKSFGLREAPSHITVGLVNQQPGGKRKPKGKRTHEGRLPSVKQQILAEYSSGLDGSSGKMAKRPKLSLSKRKTTPKRRLKGRRL
ncbi:probable ATP-dependent RNA helicase DDX31 [Asterias rubens]|uniref:probable ATP-dependent RNA helicase DDX31 n=1 Tax=Asterias rubens TaxID=7604 RepID=UPI0014552ECE|nr:probable ATP-dependent RNA helicase DDX31 [Asterias rubens]